MDSTTIYIPQEVADALRKLEKYPDEAYWRIIKRLMENHAK